MGSGFAVLCRHDAYEETCSVLGMVLAGLERKQEEVLPGGGVGSRGDFNDKKFFRESKLF